MARLPQPGGDGGAWGAILNDFLSASHTTSGELKPDIINSTHLADNAVTSSIIADDTIIEANLGPAVRAKLNTNAGTSTLNDLTDVTITGATNGQALLYQSGVWVNGGVSAGVSDHGVLTGLGDDDHTQYLNNTRGDARYYTQAAIDTALASKAATSHSHTASQISDSTATGRSVVTAADAAAARTAIGAGTSNLTLGSTSTTAKAGDYAPTKADVGLGNVDNTSDTNKPVSTAQSTALALKAPLASPTFTGTVTVPTPANPTSATTKAYVDALGSKNYIDAANYGFLTTATAAANDAAIAAAIAAATDNCPVYVRGSADVYHISVPIDLTGGQSMFGSPATTTIQQDTDTAAILKWGGERSVVSGFKFSHISLPSNTQGNGLETYDLYYSHMYDVQFQNCRTCIKDVSGNFFSNQMDTIVLTGYYESAISITIDGNTGSVWNNIYTNNKPYGNRLSAIGAPVVIENIKDTIFNQLNIEHVDIDGHALLLNSCKNITINGLHIEQVHNRGYDAAYVMAYGNTRATISGVSLEFSDIAVSGGGTGGRCLFRASAGGKLSVSSVNCENLTNTMAQTATVGTTDSGNDSRLWINGGVRPSSIMTGPSIGSVFYELRETVNSQTGTTYTLTLDDLGKTLEMSNASASTLTVPPNSSTAFALGSAIKVTQLGAGQVTLAPGAGVTLRSRGAAYKLYGQYASATLRKRGTDEWVISGDVVV